MKKKRYQLGNSFYEIPENEVSSFLKDNPKAFEVKLYDVKGSQYNIPIEESDAFEIDMGLKKKEPSQIGGGAGTSKAPSGFAELKPVKVKETGVKVPSAGEDTALARRLERQQRQAIASTAVKLPAAPKVVAEEKAAERAAEPKLPKPTPVQEEGQSWLSNVVSSLDRGFYKNLIGNPVKALGTALQMGTAKLTGGTGKEVISDALIQFGDYFNNAIDEVAPLDDEFRGSISDQFAQALGQVGSMVFTGGIGGTVSKAGTTLAQVPKVAPATVTALKELAQEAASPAAISAGLTMGQSEFDRAKKAGATDDQAFEAFYKNAAVGSVLEKIPVMQFLKRFNNATSGGVANYIKTKGVAGITGGLEEATTEVLQQIYANKTAQDIYNINQDIFEGLTESGGIGFGVGFLLNAMGAQAKILRQQGKEQEAQTLENQEQEFKARAEGAPPAGEPPVPPVAAPLVKEAAPQVPQTEETLNRYLSTYRRQLAERRKELTEQGIEDVEADEQVQNIKTKIGSTQERIAKLGEVAPVKEEAVKAGEVVEAPEAAPQAPTTQKVEPIRQLGTGSNVYFENDKYRVNDYKDKTLLNVQGTGDTGVIANLEFSTPEEAVSVAKTLNSLYPQGVPEAVLLDKVVEDIKAGKYKEQIVGEVMPQVPAAPITEEEIKTEEDAIPEPSPEGVLQPEQERIGEEGGERRGVESPVERIAAAQKGKTEAAQREINKRVKTYAPPTGKQVEVNTLINEISKFNNQKRGRLGLKKIESLKKRNELIIEAKRLGFTPTVDKQGRVYIKGAKAVDKSYSNLAIDEKFVPLESRGQKLKDLFEKISNISDAYGYDFSLFMPNVVTGADGRKMSAKQIKNALSDLNRGIPSKGANLLLNSLEEMAESGNVEIRDGQNIVTMPIDQYFKEISKEAEERDLFLSISMEADTLPEADLEKWIKEIVEEQPLESELYEPDTTEIEEEGAIEPQAEGVSEEAVPGAAKQPVSEAGEPTPTTEGGKKVGLPPTKKKELDSLTMNIPDTGRVAEYLSKGTIEKYTGETPINPQERGVQELAIALEHGEKIIAKAKELFGSDYVEKLLDYLDKTSMPTSNKALAYVSLENALAKEKIDFPDRAGEITKQQALVYQRSQEFARESSLALNYQKLRRVAMVGYDSSKVTDALFSSKELENKKLLTEAIEASPDQVNKVAEEAEEALLTEKEVEKRVEEGVKAEVEKLFSQLPKQSKTRAEKALKALAAAKAKIRSRTYDATIGIPLAIIDAGITTIENAIKVGISIEKAIDLGVKKIKEKLQGKPWPKEEDFRKETQQAFKGLDTKATGQFVKDALIKSGFGREVTIKGEKRQILDWKKLAGKAGTIEKIQENVENVLRENGFSEQEIADSREEYVQEYIDLRESIIEKAQNEIAKRNKTAVSKKQKSATKRLAELYTYGLFEQKRDEFENLINSALGAGVTEKSFNEAKKIAEAIETIYSTTFNGVRLNDTSAKVALQELQDRLRVLLYEEARTQGSTFFKLANIVRLYFDISQTLILNNLKNSFENFSSGLQQKLIDKLFMGLNKSSTKELVSQRRQLMKDIYKDMVTNGGVGYGNTETQFINRRELDDHINKMSDSKLYRSIASVVTGKATLNAMDAMFKAGLTEARFTKNLIDVLTDKNNPKSMSKEDAIKFVSENLTGQTLEQAKQTAKEVIDRINKDAGEELIPTTQEQINRFANDIVKAALEMHGVITADQIMAAYNAAYKSAGLNVGHEANNIVSETVKGYSGKLENEINTAIKEKEWNRASMLTLKSIIFRNILNPFVGGGTNWVVIKLEKTGLGLFTGLYYNAIGKKELDFTTEKGMAEMEKRLFNQSRAKDSYMRGVVGGVSSLLLYGAFLGAADEEEYRKWRAKNKWAARYLDMITPEVLLAQMAVENKNAKQYAATAFNKNDAFDASNKLIKSIDYAVKGDSPKAWGAIGESIGSKLNLPLPWRLVRDGMVLYQGVRGEDPYHGNYKPSVGFWSGVLQGGAIEWMGLRPIEKGIQIGSIKVIDQDTGEERDINDSEKLKLKKAATENYNIYISSYKDGTFTIWLNSADAVKINPEEAANPRELELWKVIRYSQLTRDQKDQLDELVQKKAINDSKKQLGF